MNGTLPEPFRDAALLVARVVLGVVLFAHGWQKLFIDGIAETRNQFEGMGIPLAIASASFVSFVEFVGGVLLIIGALVPVVVVLHLVVMIGATFVHASNGIFAENGGWEVVGVIAACELVLGACGAGRFSVDRLIMSRRRLTTDAEPAAVASGRHSDSAVRTAETASADEPVTSVFPAVTGSGFSADSSAPVFPAMSGSGFSADSSAPVFPESTSTGEQPAVRQRRIPRPITPLLGREGVRRPDPRPLDRSDGPTGP